MDPSHITLGRLLLTRTANRWSINKNQFYSEKKKMIKKSWKNWKKAICNQPYVYKFTMVELTDTPRTCVRRQRSVEPRADNFWRAKQGSRRQTFGERNEFCEKKFDDPIETLTVFFFFLNCGCGAIPPQKCHPPPPSPPDWRGDFPLSREKTIRNAKELCM